MKNDETLQDISDDLGLPVDDLETIAGNFLEERKLGSLDIISQELYGAPFRSLSAFGQQRIALLIGAKNVPDYTGELESKLAAERFRNRELEERLQEAWETIESLEIEKYELETDNNRIRRARRIR